MTLHWAIISSRLSNLLQDLLYLCFMFYVCILYQEITLHCEMLSSRLSNLLQSPLFRQHCKYIWYFGVVELNTSSILWFCSNNNIVNFFLKVKMSPFRLEQILRIRSSLKRRHEILPLFIIALRCSCLFSQQKLFNCPKRIGKW